jgi:hypothetical protein
VIADNRGVSNSSGYLRGHGLTSRNLRGRDHQKTGGSTKAIQKTIHFWEFSEIVEKVNIDKIRAWKTVVIDTRDVDSDYFYKYNPGLSLHNMA